MSAARYDAAVPEPWRTRALLPGARSALLLASGGDALWRALRSAPRHEEPHPVDAHCRRALAGAAASLARVGAAAGVHFAFEQRGGCYADFVELGRQAGLGAPSRLGLLLHPEFGPWLSIRALVLTDLAVPETPPRPDFDPCAACSAPCESACPSGAPGPSGFDLAACDRGREREAACRTHCAARRACPVGSQHAYPRETEAHHMAHR